MSRRDVFSVARLKLDIGSQMQLAGLPEPATEFLFHPSRKWRFDFCWPELRLALEREGGIHKTGGGRHNRPKGYRDDCIKYSEAALLGWVVLRITADMERSGEALALVERALRIRRIGKYLLPN